MSHLQFPTLLTHPRIPWDCAIWHPQHHHDSRLSLCRQRQPLRHGFRAGTLWVANAVCPPRCRQPSHNSPGWGLFLLTCCDVGPHLSALSLQSPCSAAHSFITPLSGLLRHRCSGEGHLSGIVLRVSFWSCSGGSSSDLTNCCSTISVHHWQSDEFSKRLVLKSQDTTNSKGISRGYFC